MDTITSEVVCKLIDPTAAAHEFAPGRWSIWGDEDQPLAMDSGHLDGIDYDFPTEVEAWEAAERFLLDRNLEESCHLTLLRRSQPVCPLLDRS